FVSAPHSRLVDWMATVPLITPGNATSSRASPMGEPGVTLKNGRARIGFPVDPATNPAVRWPRKKKLPSRPKHMHGSNQTPPLNRAPERSSYCRSLPENRIRVLSCPMTPAVAMGVPGGLVVTSGGPDPFLVHHSKYSPLTHMRKGGHISGPTQHSGRHVGPPQSAPVGGPSPHPQQL